MKQDTPDSELVESLRLIEKHGTPTKAATASGIPLPTLYRHRKLAKDRGLTAASPVLDEKAKLQTELKLLKRQIAGMQQEQETAAAIRKEIFNLAVRTPEPPAWLHKDGKGGFRGVPMTMWSDWHYGEVVRPEECGGVNEFNATIAKARVTRLVDTIIDLSFNHMGQAKTEYPGIIVCLGGDMISGDIHQELLATNDRTPYQAVNDLTDIIASALTAMADKFGRVFVPCVVGNHGRGTMKPRHKGRVFTSFEWNIYCNLERHFRGDKRFAFMIPEQSDAYFKVYNHRFLLTHGDSLGVKGGDGIIGAIGPIMRGSLKVSNSEAHIGREIDTMVIGHWHQMLWLPGVIVNNALKGYDEYARLAMRAPYSRPSQALWFVHPEHGITAKWEVFLEGQREAQQNEEWVSWPQ